MTYQSTIYWRVTFPQSGEDVWAGGAFGDLKTLKGATQRLERMFAHRNWREIEVQRTPFEGSN